MLKAMKVGKLPSISKKNDVNRFTQTQEVLPVICFHEHEAQGKRSSSGRNVNVHIVPFLEKKIPG